MKSILPTLVVLATGLALTPILHAQILWTTPTGQPYTGTTADISTSGAFVAAVMENGNGPVTVGDTTFDVGSDTNITTPGYGGSDGSGSVATPYQQALDGCSYVYSPGTSTITLNNLDATHQYQVEVWDVVADTSRTTEFSSTGPGGTKSVDVEDGFVLGTFSGVTSESFTFQGVLPTGVGEVNAVALRDITEVPEPSAYALLFAGIGALVLVARRRHRV